VKNNIIKILFIVLLICFGGCFEDKAIRIDENTSKENIDGKIYYNFVYPIYTLDDNNKNMSLKYEDITVKYCGDDNKIFCSWNKTTGNIEIKVEEKYLNDILQANSKTEAYITCYSEANYFMNSFALVDLLNNKYGVLIRFNAEKDNFFKLNVSGIGAENDGILILKRTAGGVTISNKYYCQDGTYYVRDPIADYNNSNYGIWINVPLEVYVLSKDKYAVDIINYAVINNHSSISKKKIDLIATDYPITDNIHYIPFIKNESNGGYINKSSFPMGTILYAYQEDSLGNINRNFIKTNSTQEKISLPATYLNIVQIGTCINPSFYVKDKTFTLLLDLEQNLDRIKPIVFSKEIKTSNISSAYDYEGVLDKLTFDYQIKNKISISNKTEKTLWYNLYDINKINKTIGYVGDDPNMYILQNEVDISATKAIPYLLVIEPVTNVMKITKR
jgi:hypothetical protein